MSEIEYHDIEEAFGNDAMALAERAAPGACYVGYEESLEVEYDDDSGYYLTTTAYYSGLFDATFEALSIVDPAAYQALISDNRSVDDEDEDDDSSGREHVSAADMLCRTGYADDLALQLAYQEGDLLWVCKELPALGDDAVTLAIKKDDQTLLQELAEEVELTAWAIDEILESGAGLRASLLSQPFLRASHLKTMYEMAKDDDINDDSVREFMTTVAAHWRCPTPVLWDLAEWCDAARRLDDRAATLDHLARHPSDRDPLGDLLFVAQDVGTSVATLEFLSLHTDSEVRRAVAERPNLPLVLLRVLAADRDEKVREAALSRSQVDAAFLAALSTHDEIAVRVDIARHPRASSDLLTRLSQDTWAVYREVARHPLAPPHLQNADPTFEDWVKWQLDHSPTPQDTLRDLAQSQDTEARRAVAVYTATPVDLLTALANDPDSSVRGAVATNTAAPAELLNLLSQQAALHYYLAGNPTLPQDTLRILATAQDRLSRVGAAGNPTLPHDLAVRLAQDPEFDVRYQVMRNRAMTVAVLAELAGAPDDSVREAVVEHAGVTPDLLIRLAADPSRSVRRSVARNPQTPLDVVQQMLRDPDPSVWRAALNRPGLTPATLRIAVQDTRPEVLEVLAGHDQADEGLLLSLAKAGWRPYRKVLTHPAVPAALLTSRAESPESWVAFQLNDSSRPDDLLCQFISHREVEVQAAAAVRPELTAEAIEALAGSSTFIVSRAAFRNPGLTLSALERLATSEQRDVREQVAAHPGISPAVARTLLADTDDRVRQAAAANPRLPSELLEECAAGDDRTLRSRAFTNPGLTADQLKRLAVHDNSQVRKQVAEHPEASPYLLQLLAADSDSAVRQAAHRRLK